MTGEIAGSTGSLKTSTKRQFFVRAEFDYDPSKDPSIPGDRGLSFRAGNFPACIFLYPGGNLKKQSCLF